MIHQIQLKDDAVVLPEARAMLAEAVRRRPMPNADFSRRFEAAPGTQALGEQPLLAAEIELQASPQRGLMMTVREAQGRHLSLQLNEELHAALLRLMEKALKSADWKLPEAAAPTASSAAPTAAELIAAPVYCLDAGVLPPCTPSAPPVPSPPLTVCAR